MLLGAKSLVKSPSKSRVINRILFSENHAYDHRRLTLVRYESLALTKPEHKLTMMTSLDAPGSNRISKTEVDEYIITSQVSIIQIIKKVKTSHFKNKEVPNIHFFMFFHRL